jgi:hypothetical protein
MTALSRSFILIGSLVGLTHRSIALTLLSHSA